MANIRIILHGKSAADARVKKAVHAVRKLGHKAEVRVAWEASDTAKLTAKAVRKAKRGKLDCIVAGGGDGTVNRVFAAAHEAGLPPTCSLAVLPLGTGNDFARSADIPANDPAAALRIATDATPRKIDVGLVNGRPFFNLVTGGFGSRVTAETDRELKKHLGGVAYAITGISRFAELSANHGRFRAEGFEWEGDFLAVAIGNGRYAGGGVLLCPEAQLDDGMLDLTILPALDHRARLEVYAHLLRDGAAGLKQVLPNVRSSWIEFESRENLNINLDGEPMVRKSFRARTRRQAVRVRVGDRAVLSK